MSASARRWLGAAFAVAAGIAIAWFDARPGFDAVGITVVALVLAAAVAVLIAGARTVRLTVQLGLLVGVWVPILELPGSAGAASLAAVGFALAGAAASALVVRLVPEDGFTVH